MEDLEAGTLADRAPKPSSREIDIARDQLAATVDSLAERANPRRLADDLKSGSSGLWTKPRGRHAGRIGSVVVFRGDPTGQRSLTHESRQTALFYCPELLLASWAWRSSPGSRAPAGESPRSGIPGRIGCLAGWRQRSSRRMGFGGRDRTDPARVGCAKASLYDFYGSKAALVLAYLSQLDHADRHKWENGRPPR